MTPHTSLDTITDILLGLRYLKRDPAPGLSSAALGHRCDVSRRSPSREWEILEYVDPGRAPLGDLDDGAAFFYEMHTPARLVEFAWRGCPTGSAGIDP
jgi:hypothetical protein